MHRELKAMLAELIRTCGATAVVEATPSAADIGGWRADVLGIGTGGHRVAFEVQLAGMTAQEGQERTGRYSADGIQTVWLTTKAAPWLYQVPGLRVGVPEGGGLMVLEGIAALTKDSWTVVRDVALAEWLRLWLTGGMSTPGGVYLSEDREGRSLYQPDAVVCATRPDAERWAAIQHQREVRRQKEEGDLAAHRANLAALEDRQERLLQVAIAMVAGAADAEEHVLLGVPPTPWSGQTPVRLVEAAGNPSTAQGAVIWTGRAGRKPDLRVAVCPVAGRATPSLGASWRRRGVKVVVETTAEAVRLGKALDWPISAFTPMTGPALPPWPAPPPTPPPPPQSQLTTAQRRRYQDRMLEQLLQRLQEIAVPDENVYLGNPAIRWRPHLPLRQQAAGHRRNGGSGILWVWTGPERMQITLRAIVCPDPDVLNARHGAQWRQDAVTVIASDGHEALVVAHRLGWDTTDVAVGIDSVECPAPLPTGLNKSNDLPGHVRLEPVQTALDLENAERA